MAEVLGTLRKTKSIAKKRAEEMAKKLEVGLHTKCILHVVLAVMKKLFLIF